MQFLDSLRSSMIAAGVSPPDEIQADGRIHRFSTNGRRGDTAGWYVVFCDDITAGAFGDYRIGITQNWCEKKSNEMTPEERRAFAQKMEEAKKKREQQIKDEQRKVAEVAQTIWDAAEPCETHPALEKKGVRSHGLRVGRWTRTDRDTGEIYLDLPDALLIPIRDGKKIASLQAIYPTEINGRNKDFLPGGKKRGCFFAIGKPENARDDIYICEGYSTGATIHEAIGKAVIIAFDAGNLAAVAERIRAAYLEANLIIAADNDAHGEKNTGLEGAEKAQKAGMAHIVAPDFTGLETDSKPTDFNDLMMLAGADAVREQLKPQKNEIKPEPSSEVGQVQTENVDFLTPLPDVNGKGKPLSTIENLREICRRLGVVIRYNVITKEEDILIPNKTFTLDNASNASLAWLISWCARFQMPIGQIGDFVTYLSDENAYNPVAIWINSKPWDGVSRWGDFMATVQATDEALKNILIHRWMISAVAAAVEPNGVSAHGVLVFQGDQYLGKTKWFKSLVPQELGVIQDGVQLDPKDRDSVKQATSNWLVELGEIDATFRKADVAQLKAFLTRSRDVFRRAYARRESVYARKTVFFASVNPQFYLNDPTGNRRFWTVSCTHLDHSHNLDMQQVWAEFLDLYKNGEGFYLTPDEFSALNELNESFTSVDPIQEKIERLYTWDALPAFWEWKTATEILISVGFDRPNKSDVTRAASVIRKLNGGQAKRQGSSRLLAVPPMLKDC